jgi:hypothetical protein
MRFLIRKAVVENSLYIKYYNVNNNALSHKNGSSENTFYNKYSKVNINELSNKDDSSG